MTATMGAGMSAETIAAMAIPVMVTATTGGAERSGLAICFLILIYPGNFI
jgi:hypothetical protein